MELAIPEENVLVTEEMELQYPGDNILMTQESIVSHAAQDCQTTPVHLVNSPICDLEKSCVYAVPCTGMEFDSVDDVYKFYNEYARRIGFGITTVCSRSKTGICIYKHLACSRWGQARKSATAMVHRDSSKIGCKAFAKAAVDGVTLKWKITDVCLEHNHELHPIAAAFLRSHRRISTPEKAEIKNMHAVGVPTSQIISTIARRKGGIRRLDFREKDCRNFLDRERQTQLKEGDAQTMAEHFRLKHVANPTFFYVLDLNEQQQLRSVFWIHPRSRMACKYFSDVVTFDTTYLTNTYQMPFAPFVGVNHHGQSVLLGCALLSNEKIESFVWVFRCWVEANGGQEPKCIITDQDKAIEGAVREVFPNARHRFCLWHILKKVPEKIGHICRANATFMSEFDECIYDTLTTEQFEKQWEILMSTYTECNDNVWLQDLYECRHKWVPVFLKDSFFAGMSSSQRSESINHFFDGYVNTKTTLNEFIAKYEIALEARVDAEIEADVKCKETVPHFITSSPFERQAGNLYTRAIFKKFQDELVEVAACHPSIIEFNEYQIVLKIKSFQRVRVNDYVKEVVHDYVVTYEKQTEDVYCQCKSFEFKGYLCRHALVALQFSGVLSIPEKYFLRRWRKDMRYRHADDESANILGFDKSLRESRFSDLCSRLMVLAEVGSSTEVAYDTLMKELPALKRRMIDIGSISSTQEQPHDDEGITSIHINDGKQTVLDPPMASAKGRKREKRIKSSIEISRRRSTQKKTSRVGLDYQHVPESFVAGSTVEVTVMQVNDVFPSSQSSVNNPIPLRYNPFPST